MASLVNNYKMKKYKGCNNCSVQSCKNTSANSICRFFRFPKDERTKRWIIACNRQDLMLKTAEHLYAVYRVCSDHFEERMYANDLKNRLLPSALPTLNLSKNRENDRNIANTKILPINNTETVQNAVEIDYISDEIAPNTSQKHSSTSHVSIKANFHDYIKTTSKSEFLPQTEPPSSLVSKLNCTNVQMNVSSTARNATSLHNSGIKYNEVTPETVLKPVHSVSTSLQPAIISSANCGIVTNPKITVAGPFYVYYPFSPERVLRNTEHEVKLSKKQSLDKKVQTTKNLYAPNPTKLKLQKEIRILKKENIALRKKIEKIDLSRDKFLKYCEKYLSPEAALFLKEQVLLHKAKDRRYSL